MFIGNYFKPKVEKYGAVVSTNIDRGYLSVSMNLAA